MKKLLTAKSLSLLMLLSLFGGKAEAGRNYEDGYVSESRDCCISSCYECGCNPLYCGAWDLQIQGGVQPIIWNKRSNVFAVNCAASSGVSCCGLVTQDLNSTISSKLHGLLVDKLVITGQIILVCMLNSTTHKPKANIQCADCTDFTTLHFTLNHITICTNTNCLMRMLVHVTIGIAGVIALPSSLVEKLV